MNSPSYKQLDRSTPRGRQIVHCIRVPAKALKTQSVTVLPVAAPPVRSAKHMETVASAFRRIKNSDERGIRGEESNDPVLVVLRGYGDQEAETAVLRCGNQILLSHDTIEFHTLQTLVRERKLTVRISQANPMEQHFSVRNVAEQQIKQLVERLVAAGRLLYSVPAGAPAPTRISQSSILVEPGLPVSFASTSETLPLLCERHNAIAGINGGFFLNMPEELTTVHSAMNDMVGLFLADGKLNPPPIYYRGAIFFPQHGGPEIRRIGMWDVIFEFPQGLRFVPSQKAIGSDKEVYACLVNPKERGVTKEPIIYTRAFGAKTPELPGAYDLVIVGDQVVEISEGGNTFIPYNGFVLCLGNQFPALKELLKDVQSETPSNRIRYQLQDSALADRVSAGLGAGPVLLLGGKKRLPGERRPLRLAKEEFWTPQLPPSRFDCYGRGALYYHPRSAIGITHEGDLLLVTVDDDRQVHLPGEKRISIGATLPELADILYSLGAVDALNLDGGGSATLWYNGQVANRPSDGTPRLISTAILVKETS